MTIRLQIWTKSARTQLKSADHEARAAFFASITGAEWRETQEKGTDSKLTCQGEKGGQTQNLTMASPRYCVFLVRKAAMEGSRFFFSPLWEMSFSTRPWQFSNDGRLDTISVTHEKRDSDRFFFSPPEEYVSDNMSAWSQPQPRDQFGTPSALQHGSPETAQK